MTTRVDICCGVGGTGKTTVAAAMGVGHALRGERTVVLTIDPARRLANALGVERLGDAPRPVALDGADDRLHALMLDRKETFDRVVRRFSRSAERADKLIANRYYRAVSTRLTGSHEYMAIEKLHELVSSGAWDRVVVDTPPARHVVDFFEAPDRVRRVFERGVLQALLEPSSGWLSGASGAALSVLRRLAGDRVMEDIAEFFQLVADLSSGMRDRNAEVATLLASERTTWWLVANADAPDRGDLLGFVEALRERHLHPGGFLLNRCAPAPPDHPLEPWPDLGLAPDQAAAWREAITAIVADRAARHRAHQTAATHLSRAGGDLPVWMVPDAPEGLRSIAGLEALAKHLPRP